MEIKTWKLVDSEGSYLYAFDIYQGKSQERESGNGLPMQVVLDLDSKLPHGNLFDNYYTSSPVFEKLLERGHYCAGTIRTNDT